MPGGSPCVCVHTVGGEHACVCVHTVGGEQACVRAHTVGGEHEVLSLDPPDRHAELVGEQLHQQDVGLLLLGEAVELAEHLLQRGRAGGGQHLLHVALGQRERLGHHIRDVEVDELLDHHVLRLDHGVQHRTEGPGTIHKTQPRGDQGHRAGGQSMFAAWTTLHSRDTAADLAGVEGDVDARQRDGGLAAAQRDLAALGRRVQAVRHGLALADQLGERSRGPGVERIADRPEDVQVAQLAGHDVLLALEVEVDDLQQAGASIVVGDLMPTTGHSLCSNYGLPAMVVAAITCSRRPVLSLIMSTSPLIFSVVKPLAMRFGDAAIMAKSERPAASRGTDRCQNTHMGGEGAVSFGFWFGVQGTRGYQLAAVGEGPTAA